MDERLEQYLADKSERGAKFALGEMINETLGDEQSARANNDIESFTIELENIILSAKDINERYAENGMTDELVEDITALIEERKVLRRKVKAWAEYYADELPEIKQAIDEGWLAQLEDDDE